jgi:hypothetical protein
MSRRGETGGDLAASARKVACFLSIPHGREHHRGDGLNRLLSNLFPELLPESSGKVSMAMAVTSARDKCLPGE